MSWQSDLELARLLMETNEPVTYTQAMKINISLITGVHDRLDRIEDKQDGRDLRVNKNAERISNMEGRVNVGIGLSVLVGLAGAVALFL